MERQYRMSDGKYTKKVDEYLKSYEDIVSNIVRLTGAKINSYDPSICLLYEGRVIELSLSFARKLNEVLGDK